jgi:hypothetical protein
MAKTFYYRTSGTAKTENSFFFFSTRYKVFKFFRRRLQRAKNNASTLQRARDRHYSTHPTTDLDRQTHVYDRDDVYVLALDLVIFSHDRSTDFVVRFRWNRRRGVVGRTKPIRRYCGPSAPRECFETAYFFRMRFVSHVQLTFFVFVP